VPVVVPCFFFGGGGGGSGFGFGFVPTRTVFGSAWYDEYHVSS
jgi:hypothetical protein